VVSFLWLALWQVAGATPAPGMTCGVGAPLVIEKQVLKGVGQQRAFVLWMCNADAHESDFDPEAYTCPDQTMGHYYQGRTFVSLIDLQNSRVINTVAVVGEWSQEQTFYVPYKIRGYFYHVDGPLDKNNEGKPKLLWLKEYNGDGEALEFALFDAYNCTIVETTLFGYSKSRDRVIQYPIHLIQHEGATVTVRDSPWLDRFMLQKPIKPGLWKWQYQYHKGGLTHFELRFNAAKEMFEGEVVIDAERDSTPPRPN